MSIYMSRLFGRSNSSFLLRTGNAVEAKVVRLRDQMYLVDAGIGRPQIANQEELINPPDAAGAAFSARVGFLKPSNKESPVRTLDLERCFVDLVSGTPRSQAQATARLDDLIGLENSAVGDQQPFLMPRRFRKRQAWLELKNKMKNISKVKGFVAQKVRGGYSIGIAGYLAFLPARQLFNRRVTSDRFSIEKMTQRNIIVNKIG